MFFTLKTQSFLQINVNCKNEKCIENKAQLIKQFPELWKDENDSDYIFNHCQALDCHDISLGNTSFNCSDCGDWMCQDHIRSLGEFDEYELENEYCLQCLKKWELNKKIKEYKDDYQTDTKSLKCDRQMRICNAENCVVKKDLEKCQKCKRVVCINHLTDCFSDTL